jgi:hypothetical protein
MLNMIKDFWIDRKYRWSWVKRIWNEKTSHHYTCVCERVLGTLVVLFGPWADEEGMDWTPLAQQDTGTYWTDYGQGMSWDTLVFKGFRWTVYDDGNL